MVVCGEVVPRDDLDTGFRQRRFDQLLVDPSVTFLQRVRGVGDVCEDVERRRAQHIGNGKARDNAAFEPRHAHHKKLVQVAGKDG